MAIRTTTSIFLFATAAFTTLTACNRVPVRQQSSTSLTNFLLVTTTQCPPTNHSSALANVSATSLFDPFDQSTFLLRLIEPGYNSLPTFNLTNGDLHTISSGIEGFGTYVYNSTGVVTAGEELGLKAHAEPAGNLALKNGYLLTVDGEEWGWTVCDGELEESVIYWKGKNSSCVPTYIHAVKDAPY